MGHQIVLSWSEAVSGLTFNVYRGAATGGPYTKLTATPLAASISPNYTDTSIAPSTDYYYVVTAVDSTGLESSFSNEVHVKSASAPPAPTGLTGTAS